MLVAKKVLFMDLVGDYCMDNRSIICQEVAASLLKCEYEYLPEAVELSLWDDWKDVENIPHIPIKINWEVRSFLHYDSGDWVQDHFYNAEVELFKVIKERVDGAIYYVSLEEANA